MNERLMRVDLREQESEAVRIDNFRGGALQKLILQDGLDNNHGSKKYSTSVIQVVS